MQQNKACIFNASWGDSYSNILLEQNTGIKALLDQYFHSDTLNLKRGSMMSLLFLCTNGVTQKNQGSLSFSYVSVTSILPYYISCLTKQTLTYKHFK